jgi:hypothetical protein
MVLMMMMMGRNHSLPSNRSEVVYQDQDHIDTQPIDIDIHNQWTGQEKEKLESRMIGGNNYLVRLGG